MNCKTIVSISICVLLFSGCSQKKEVKNATEQTLNDSLKSVTSVQSVDNRPISDELTLNGKIDFDNDEVAQVSSMFGGSIASVHAELGDYVRKGSVLAVVRSGDVASYDKEREEARQQLQLAQRNLNASKELYASGMASKKDLIISKQDMANALAEIRRINTIYHIYHLSPNAVYQIKAPVSGYVVQKSINPQMQISQNDSPVFTISGLTNVWVIANVYENDISKIHQGMPVRITTLAYPDKEFSGKIEKVYNMLDEDNKTMQVRITLPNRQHLLKPGMMANVYVECNNSGQSMPCIDQHGLIFDNGKNYVVVVKNNNNKLEIREVDVYKQNSRSAYISRGLNVGERIIVKNALLVYTSLEI